MLIPEKRWSDNLRSSISFPERRTTLSGGQMAAYQAQKQVQAPSGQGGGGGGGSSGGGGGGDYGGGDTDNKRKKTQRKTGACSMRHSMHSVK